MTEEFTLATETQMISDMSTYLLHYEHLCLWTLQSHHVLS